jgi:hypothetical protein
MKAARFALRQIQSDRAHFAHEPLIGGLQDLHLEAAEQFYCAM